METGSSFTQDSEKALFIAEKTTGALGRFIFPVFRNRVSKEYSPVIYVTDEGSFYKDIYGDNSEKLESFYTKCGNGAYMGLTSILEDEKEETFGLIISFFLADRDYTSVETALLKQYEMYVKDKREQFEDIRIEIPPDWFKGENQRLKIEYASMDICIRQKKQTLCPVDIEVFSKKLRRSTRAKNVSALGIDFIGYTLDELREALLTNPDIAMLWDEKYVPPYLREFSDKKK